MAVINTPKSNSKKTLVADGEVRIIGGSCRGRKLRFASVEGLRPSLDRIRETLFNWLAFDIANTSCLDLFAGSGALGFEAASRGASDVILVEQNPQACEHLRNNLRLFKLPNMTVLQISALDFLKSNERQFDLVFLDPPFGKNLLEHTIQALIPRLKANALIYIERELSSQPLVVPNNWRQLKSQQTSRFHYALYRTDLSSP